MTTTTTQPILASEIRAGDHFHTRLGTPVQAAGDASIFPALQMVSIPCVDRLYSAEFLTTETVEVTR